MHPALIPLDPLFKAYVKLFIKDIHALQAVEDAPIGKGSIFNQFNFISRLTFHV